MSPTYCCSDREIKPRVLPAGPTRRFIARAGVVRSSRAQKHVTHALLPNVSDRWTNASNFTPSDYTARFDGFCFSALFLRALLQLLPGQSRKNEQQPRVGSGLI